MKHRVAPVSRIRWTARGCVTVLTLTVFGSDRGGWNKVPAIPGTEVPTLFAAPPAVLFGGALGFLAATFHNRRQAGIDPRAGENRTDIDPAAARVDAPPATVRD